MKKLMLTAVLAILSMTQMFALSTSSVRNHARFISDRMAYELDLSPAQYDDIYEINFDFIYQVNRIMDDVVYGYRDAIDRYYDYLDDRNDDIRYVLTSRQYRRFLDCEYFYRPLYSTGRNWSFRIYTIYSNRSFFYFDAPLHYKTYIGAHSRVKYASRDYYRRRYESQRHDRYEPFVIRKIEPARRHVIRRNDFGAIERHRNDAERNKVNNYNNSNSSHRTDNKYYRDDSGNKRSPEINRRNRTSSNTSGTVNSGNRTTTTRSSSTTTTNKSTTTTTTNRGTTTTTTNRSKTTTTTNRGKR
ncbi:MAG: hypothetical protein K6E86_09045 [Bacteroidales bacterium]|nr:hypothetical protein [Bacteroidales bacterium]